MFDARESSVSSDTVGRSILAIGLIVLVFGSLTAALLWPTAPEREAAKLAEYQVNLTNSQGNTLALAMPDIQTIAFTSAFMELDGQAYESFENEVKKSRSQDQAAQSITHELEAIFHAHAPLLAQVQPGHIDEMLSLTHERLRQAERSNSPLCASTHYGGSGQSQRAEPATLGMVKSLARQTPETWQYSIDMVTLVLNGANDARKARANNGPVRNIDKAALQGLIFSLMNDGEVRQAIQAYQENNDRAAAIANMDMCAVAITAVSALKTLPQDTKGRLWGDLMQGGEGLAGLF